MIISPSPKAQAQAQQTILNLNTKKILDDWLPGCEKQQTGLEIDSKGVVTVVDFEAQIDITNRGQSVEKQYLLQTKIFNTYLKSLQTYISDKHEHISKKARDSKDLYTAEKYISSLHGLQIHAELILTLLQAKYNILKDNINSCEHSQREALISSSENILKLLKNIINNLPAKQKESLMSEEENPIIVFNLMAGTVELISTVHYFKPIGNPSFHGGMTIEAKFCSKFEARNLNPYAPILSAAMDIKVHFQESNNTVTFRLAQFWPEANLLNIHKILNMPQQTQAIESILFSPIDQALEKTHYDDEYLTHVFSDNNPKQKPSLLMLLPRTKLSTVSLQEYAIITQVAIEWAVCGEFGGVYRVLNNGELLSNHALGFRQFEPAEETPLLEPTDEKLHQRALTIHNQNDDVLRFSNEYTSEDDNQNNKRIMKLDAEDLYKDIIFSTSFNKTDTTSFNKTDTTSWHKIIRTKPLLFSHARWPNFKGLSPQPDMSYQDLINRQLTGEKSRTQEISCSLLKPQNIFHDSELTKVGRLGVTQLGEKGQELPEDQDNPKRTWRPR